MMLKPIRECRLLRPDIDADRDINYQTLLRNANIEAVAAWSRLNPDRIDWSALCRYSPGPLFTLLCDNPGRIDCLHLSENMHPDAVPLLLQHVDIGRINLDQLSRNPHPDAVAYLRANPQRICWSEFCKNTNPDAIAILAENIHQIRGMIHWANLAENPTDAAVQLLINCLDGATVNVVYPGYRRELWREFISNSNPIAFAYCLEHLDEIIGAGGCIGISRNESQIAMEWLREHPWFIDWMELSTNPHPIAVEILLDNPAEVYWEMFVQNENPVAVQHVRAHPAELAEIALDATAHLTFEFDYKTWINYADLILAWIPEALAAGQLSATQAAARRRTAISLMPDIFVDEYRDIACDYFREHVVAELMALVWHPRNMKRFRCWDDDCLEIAAEAL